jgi:hypothetical protein
MDLSKILSISGKGGLFRLISQTKSGALVQSLIDGKKVPAFATDRISALEDISIFTTEKEVPLKEVLLSIFKHEDEKDIPFDISKASEQKLVEYMREILPNFDEDRVYPSDMKKLFKWYNILNKSKFIDLAPDQEESAKELEQSIEVKEKDEQPKSEAKPTKTMVAKAESKVAAAKPVSKPNTTTAKKSTILKRAAK